MVLSNEEGTPHAGERRSSVLERNDGIYGMGTRLRTAQPPLCELRVRQTGQDRAASAKNPQPFPARWLEPYPNAPLTRPAFRIIMILLVSGAASSRLEVG